MGVFGRKAATHVLSMYSEALQKSKIVWNDDHLDKWLTIQENTSKAL